MPAHSHNLSINSIASIIEPTTPPSLQNQQNYHKPQHFHKRSHLNLWDQQQQQQQIPSPNFVKSNDITLPSLHLEDSPFPKPQSNNGCRSSSTSSLASTSAASKTPSTDTTVVKIDKEYLASLGKYPLNEIKLKILSLSKDQYGCRFLQKKIDENIVSNYATRMDNFETIFQEIYPFFYELIIDPFGNYLIQKLVTYCDERKLNLILEILQYNLFQISINQHGTRALQKIIDSLNNEYQLNLLTKGLKPYIIELIKDLNGNHVIQKILNKFSPTNCQFIYDSILNDLIVVATHKHGCCVLQKCLNHVTDYQLVQFSNVILEFKNFYKLINDQFGNYVLQYLILINSIDINYKVFDGLVKFGINNLCNLKFSSNVVEKFLKNCFINEANHKFAAKLYTGTDDATNNFNVGDPVSSGTPAGDAAGLQKNNSHPLEPNQLSSLLDGLNISKRTSSPLALTFTDLKYELIYQILITDLNKLINDPYGNYVIQTLLDVLNTDYNSEKLQLLLPYEYELYNESVQFQVVKKWFMDCKIVSSFGKRIQLKINTILSNSNMMKQPPHQPLHQLHQNQLQHQHQHHQNQHQLNQLQQYGQLYQNMKPQQMNINTNQEFINTSPPPFQQLGTSSRSLSLGSVTPINQNHQRAGSFQSNYILSTPQQLQQLQFQQYNQQLQQQQQQQQQEFQQQLQNIYQQQYQQLQQKQIPPYFQPTLHSSNSSNLSTPGLSGYSQFIPSSANSNTSTPLNPYNEFMNQNPQQFSIPPYFQG